MLNPTENYVLNLANTIARLERRVQRLEGVEKPTPGTSSYPGFLDSEGNPADVAAASNDGASTYPSRRDHVHTIGGSVITYAMLGSTAINAFVGTADYVGGTILTKLLTVDGTGSGLDADLLDGLNSTAFSGTAHTHDAYSGTAHTHDAYSGTAHTHDAYLPLSGGTVTGNVRVDGNIYAGTILPPVGAPLVLATSGGAAVASVTTGDIFSVNGTAHFAGSVGIGTAAPGYDLHIKNDQSGVTDITLENISTNGAAAVQYRLDVGAPEFALGLAGTAHTTLPDYAGMAYMDANTSIDGFIVSATKSGGFFEVRSGGRATSNTRLYIDGTNIGVNTRLPQGPLHIYTANGSCGFFTKTGINTTPQEIIPNGSFDVTKILRFTATMSTSGGTASAVGGLTPGASQAFTCGSDTFNLRVNANGSVDVVRTAGSNAGQLAVFLVWH